jgi:hypothetical protein
METLTLLRSAGNHLGLIAAISGLAIGCGACSALEGSPNDPPPELTSCSSWIATARATVDRWIDGSVTRVFTRQTLEEMERELPKEMVKIPRDTLRGDLARLLPASARTARRAALNARRAIEALDRERARIDLDSLAAADSILSTEIDREYPRR